MRQDKRTRTGEARKMTCDASQHAPPGHVIRVVRNKLMSMHGQKERRASASLGSWKCWFVDLPTFNLCNVLVVKCKWGTLCTYQPPPPPPPPLESPISREENGRNRHTERCSVFPCGCCRRRRHRCAFVLLSSASAPFYRYESEDIRCQSRTTDKYMNKLRWHRWMPNRRRPRRAVRVSQNLHTLSKPSTLFGTNIVFHFCHFRSHLVCTDYIFKSKWK